MRTKEYLLQYQLWKNTRENLLSERNLIVMDEALPSGIDYSADKIQATPVDKMSEIVARIEKRTAEIDRRIISLDTRMEQMRDDINDLDDAVAVRLLWLKYIESQNWYDIAAELGYDVVYVRGELHQKSLDIFRGKNLQRLTQS